MGTHECRPSPRRNHPALRQVAALQGADYLSDPMTTFAILSPPDNPQLQGLLLAMERVFPGGAFHMIDRGQWIAVKANATSQQISNELGPNGEVGKFIVFTTAGHWGWYDKPVWEWLSVRGATP